MKFQTAAIASLASAAMAAPVEERDQVYGLDVSNYQSSVDWNAAYNNGGLRFALIKATEGLSFKDPKFSDHYVGASNAGFIRGGYHFAHGDESASAQAEYFYNNGGGWTADGITLPGMLDLEGDCISVDWIQEFVDRYHELTGRYCILYSNPNWWKTCTGNTDRFVNTNPLDMACYASSPCTPQGHWPYNDHNPYGGDSDVFSASYSQLQKLATG